MKKKVIASMLALSMIAGTSSAVFAAENTTAEMADASEVDGTTISFWHSCLLYTSEKEKAASEQEIICPIVIHPAIIKEFIINFRSGTFLNALMKLLHVGCFGRIFNSVVKSSLDLSLIHIFAVFHKSFCIQKICIH